MTPQRRRWLYAGLGILTASAFLYAWRNRPVRVQTLHPEVETSLKKLDSTFAGKVRTLMHRLEARGFAPMIWETCRSQDRAQLLAELGTGSAHSMHVYGLAVDIVEVSALWDASAAFWAALGQEARALGLIWGGDWSSDNVDKPHVQAVPLSAQPQIRSTHAPC
jgi:peptidoglycan L-alanyl-D-glutamate endopeptidase CwlK